MTTPSSVTKFCVYYDGDAHADHEMDILAFGRSVTALGQSLYAANEVLNGYDEAADMEVKINADFIEGSFGFEVEIFQYMANAKDIAVALGFTAAASGGVLAVVDWLKGRSIEVSDGTSKGKKTITAGDSVSEFNDDIVSLVEDKRVRKALETVIHEPLNSSGTSTFAIKKSRDDKKAVVKITEEEAESYKAPPHVIKEEKTTSSSEERVMFVNASVDKKTGWRMWYKEQNLSVRMNDEGFLARLKNREEAYVFGKVFNVKLIKTQKVSGSTEKVSYSIEKVHHESKG